MSPTRRNLLKAFVGIGAATALPQLTPSSATTQPIDPDDEPVWEDGRWTTWRELNQPRRRAADRVESMLMVFIGDTKAGEQFNLMLRMIDGELQQCQSNGTWFTLDRVTPEVYDLPKYLQRQIGCAALEADEWNPIRRRVAAEG